VRSGFCTHWDLHDPAVAIPEEVTAAHWADTAGTNKIPASCRVSYAACRAAASNPVRIVTQFSTQAAKSGSATSPCHLCRRSSSTPDLVDAD
jgi:hypothetical protein